MKWPEAFSDAVQALVLGWIVFSLSTCFYKSLTKAEPAPVTYEDLKPIIQARCQTCHDGTQNHTVLDEKALTANRYQVLQRVVIKKDMPNIPGMTDNERTMFKLWVNGVAR